MMWLDCQSLTGTWADRSTHGPDMTHGMWYVTDNQSIQWLNMLKNQALFILFILIYSEYTRATPLTMGFGKTIKLPHNNDHMSARAFDFNIFPSSGEHFEDPFIKLHEGDQTSFHGSSSRLHSGPHHLLEIDLKFAKKKPIPGVRHLFCSGYYCAFEYAGWALVL